MSLSLLVTASALLCGALDGNPYVCAPSYCREDVRLAPVEPFAPQPGDLFLATDPSPVAWFGHWVAGGPGLHHSGILFARPDGTMGLLEGGPYNTLFIRTLEPYEHMCGYVSGGSRVYIRRRQIPLTPEQSARLTAFALSQDGKPFALTRMLRQVTPFKTRGVLRTPFLGHARGPDHPRFYCSELVVEACVYAGLMDAETARPSATYPRDLFDGRSRVPYLDRNLCMEPSWLPPSRWLPAEPDPSTLLQPPPALPVAPRCWQCGANAPCEERTL